MRGALLLVVALILAGCVSDQKKQIAACKLDAFRSHPGDAEGYSPSSLALQQEVNRDITLCMKINGYDYDVSDQGCQPDWNVPLAQQDFCYLPSGYIDRAEFSFERWLDLEMKKQPARKASSWTGATGLARYGERMDLSPIGEKSIQRYCRALRPHRLL